MLGRGPWGRGLLPRVRLAGRRRSSDVQTSLSAVRIASVTGNPLVVNARWAAR